MGRATIALYQGLVFPPLEGTPGTWDHAIQRCLEACDGITNVLQGFPDVALQNMSPLIIPCIFAAIRFRLGTSKSPCSNTEIPLFNKIPSPFQTIRPRLRSPPQRPHHKTTTLRPPLGIRPSLVKSHTSSNSTTRLPACHTLTTHTKTVLRLAVLIPGHRRGAAHLGGRRAHGDVG